MDKLHDFIELHSDAVYAFTKLGGWLGSAVVALVAIWLLAILIGTTVPQWKG